jgi:hypothetical protein
MTLECDAGHNSDESGKGTNTNNTEADLPETPRAHVTTEDERLGIPCGRTIKRDNREFSLNRFLVATTVQTDSMVRFYGKSL